jgi:hypothetical protein
MVDFVVVDVVVDSGIVEIVIRLAAVRIICEVKCSMAGPGGKVNKC